MNNIKLNKELILSLHETMLKIRLFEKTQEGFLKLSKKDLLTYIPGKRLLLQAYVLI